MKSKLTLRQRELYNYIGNYICVNNRPPTRPELQKYMVMRQPELYRMLKDLRNLELITWEKNYPETLQMLEPGK